MAAWPRVVGITANTSQVKGAWRAAQALREAGCTAPIVLGGVHASVLPEETLVSSPVDIVVRGEGEETWAEVCAVRWSAAADWQTALAGMAGVSYRATTAAWSTTPTARPSRT